MKKNKSTWFREAKFGLFIHFGLYSLLGRGEQVLFREHLSPKEYRKLIHKFKAEKFDADEWMRLASKAGMKYTVLTAKHCDGFCLFNTATTNYNSMYSAAGRDFVKEYVESARKYGLKIGIYYSPMDWNDPAYFDGPENSPEDFKKFLKKIHTQIEELCTNYGLIDELWFDGDLHMFPQDSYPGDPKLWEVEKIQKIIKKYQPQTLVNERLGMPQDIQTSERHIGKKESSELSETCMVSQNRWWGYIKGDSSWYTARELVQQLCLSVGNDSNYLLNVGPLGNGKMPVKFVKLANKIGEWLEVNGESIYGAMPNPGLETQTYGSISSKGNILYMHIFYWPGSEIHLPGIKNKIISIELLKTGKLLNFKTKDGHVYILNAPRKAPDKFCSTLKITLEKKAKLTEWANMHLWGTRDKSMLADWVRNE